MLSRRSELRNPRNVTNVLSTVLVFSLLHAESVSSMSLLIATVWETGFTYNPLPPLPSISTFSLTLNPMVV